MNSDVVQQFIDKVHAFVENVSSVLPASIRIRLRLCYHELQML